MGWSTWPACVGWRAPKPVLPSAPTFPAQPRIAINGPYIPVLQIPFIASAGIHQHCADSTPAACPYASALTFMRGS